MGCIQSKDMAICFVFFNPAESKRLLMNYLYVANLYKSFGWPVYTIELVFEDRRPEIVDAIHVRGNSYMFHKERLCRLLEKQIPSKYTKLAFIDADVIFESNAWYAETSKLLETHDVVQPFETCHWMDLSYTKIELTRESVLKMSGDKWDSSYHPGFAWAFRRDWYKKQGFFDLMLSGSGDTLSCIGWMKKKIPKSFNSLPKSVERAFKEFAQLPEPRMAYREGGEAFHLYHGTRKNRQYVERHSILNVSNDIEDMITTNDDGVYEWKQLKVNAFFVNYFVSRFDDDLSN